LELAKWAGRELMGSGDSVTSQQSPYCDKSRQNAPECAIWRVFQIQEILGKTHRIEKMMKGLGLKRAGDAFCVMAGSDK